MPSYLEIMSAVGPSPLDALMRFQKALGLTPAQVWFLWAVTMNHGASMDELAAASGVSRSTLFDAQRKLSEAGLLDSEGNPMPLWERVAKLCRNGSGGRKASEFDALALHEKLFVLDGFQCKACSKPVENKAKKEKYSLRKVFRGDDFMLTRVTMCEHCGGRKHDSDKMERLSIYVEGRRQRLLKRMGGDLTDREKAMLDYINGKLGDKHRHFEKESEAVGVKESSEIRTDFSTPEGVKGTGLTSPRVGENKEKIPPAPPKKEIIILPKNGVELPDGPAGPPATHDNPSPAEDLERVPLPPVSSTKGVRGGDDDDDMPELSTSTEFTKGKENEDVGKKSKKKLEENGKEKMEKFQKRLAEVMAMPTSEWGAKEGSIWFGNELSRRFGIVRNEESFGERNKHVVKITEALGGDMDKFKSFTEWVMDHWHEFWFSGGDMPTTRTVAARLDELMSLYAAGDEMGEKRRRSAEKAVGGAVNRDDAPPIIDSPDLTDEEIDARLNALKVSCFE